MYRGESKQELFCKLLRVIADSGSDLPRKYLTGFIGMQGIHSTGELVIVGRAVNGWEEKPGWYPEDMKDLKARLEKTRKLFERSQGNGSLCPMRWVTDAWYRPVEWNAKTSQFWRDTRSIVKRLGISEVENETWPCHLAWTNLYKISPTYERNPNRKLGELQLAFCLHLLNLELAEFTPKRLLLMTGVKWAQPFLDSWGQQVGGLPSARWVRTPQHAFVEAMGTFTLPTSSIPAKLVVTCHPQGKPDVPFVDEVIRVLTSDSTIGN